MQMKQLAALAVFTLTLWAEVPAKPTPYRPNNDEEKMAFLLSAEIVKSRGIKEGITGSRRMTLVYGGSVHDAHFQSVDEWENVHKSTKGVELNFRDSYRFNIAAYELSRYLGMGMVPVSVERKVHQTRGALTWWVDDVAMTNRERTEKGLRAPDQARWSQQAYVMWTFDALIANADRNMGNLLITKDWDMWLVDHTRAFRRTKHLPHPNRLLRCERKLLERMRSMDENKMSRLLRPYLDHRELKALLTRAELLVAHFDAEIARRGEENVLFDR